MKVIYDLGKYKKGLRNSVVAIGIFDGIHKGHRALILKAVQRAKKIHGQSVVLTFDPHPVRVLRPELNLPYLISLKHRLKLIEDLGVDVCCIIPFTKQFSRLSPKTFVQKYLRDALGVKEVFVGDDFRFGKDREGGLGSFKNLAREFGFRVNAVHAIKHGEKNVSSTRLRELVFSGQLDKACKLLGRRFSIYGRVVHGEGRGRLLGFPTANIEFENDVLPPNGVYLVRVRLMKNNIEYPGIANIGFRPSFKKDHVVHLEVYILDFNSDLYGQEILVEFIRKVREEKEFPSRQQLVQQIQKDVQAAHRFFK